MKSKGLFVLTLALTVFWSAPLAGAAPADDNNGKGHECDGLPSFSALRDALKAARLQPNGGFALHMWGTVVNRDGVVCAVAFTGAARDDHGPAARVISAKGEYR
jgi:hypothetical protein